MVRFIEVIQFIASLIIIALLSGIAVALRHGFNEIIRGLESIDERLARMERTRGAD